MAYSLVASVALTPAANGNTSSSIDTTGASLLIFGISRYSGGPSITVSDSKGNTWTALTSAISGEAQAQIFYAKNPNVGSGHTFSVAGTGIAHASFGLAFSGADTTAPFDAQRSDTTGSGTSLAMGSITPSQDNELLVTVISNGSGATNSHSINSSYTKVFGAGYTGSVNEAGAIAYLIQTTAAASSPTWSWTGTAVNVAVIATFKAGAAAAFIAPPGRLILQAVHRASTY